MRIIVPACARCNHRRGCRELVLFLLLRPRRISAFLDHLSSLSPESIRQLDPRVFAELYAAIWMLSESAGHGAEWRAHLRRLCSGRTLHRRRYAARRLVGAVGGRAELLRDRDELLPEARWEEGGPTDGTPSLDATMHSLNTRLVAVLATAWQISTEEIQRHISLQHRQEGSSSEADGVVRLDGWRRRQRRRVRVDRRGGRAATRRAGGRAA